MVRLALAADCHGFLPEIPECDAVLLAGDLVPCYGFHSPAEQAYWYKYIFDSWAKKVNKPIIFCAGNHERLRPAGYEIKTKYADYLENSIIRKFDLKIWGSPNSLPFGWGWAFNSTEEQLEKIYSEIPEDTDVIISHGPAYGLGDRVWEGNGRWGKAGSKALLAAVERIQPKLMVTGHLHLGAGIYQCGKTTVVNAALLDDSYKVVNKPTIVEI